MIFEQKLVISKIWAKKSTKNRQKWGFSLILGVKNLKIVKMTILTLLHLQVAHPVQISSHFD